MRLRPQFTLRTLLIAIALLSIPMCWVAYQLNWIRQRHELLAKKLPSRYAAYMEIQPGFPIPKAPWQLRLFGEEGRNLIGVIEPNVPRAIKLFPEAYVAIIPDEPDEPDQLSFYPGIRMAEYRAARNTVAVPRCADGKSSSVAQ
jgi:hypothetical protein